MPPNPLSLKQRLTALSSSIPAVARSDTPPQSPIGKRRPFPSFGKPRNADINQAEHHDHEKVQDVMNKLIFQAGVDYETRPMVVMNASALPDPREVSYDLLLSRILSYLNLYVESDYTVVFLAAGSRHTPGWNWVWKAYRSLSRKYRKNLKRLFIVHSNFFTKMLFSLAGAIISPKFFRKITYINTLSELAYHVPLTQIDIPPAVYQENLKYERQITLPMASRANLFGVPLEQLMGFDGEKGGLPRVVKDCIQYLRECGLQEEGLFRRSPSSVLLKQAAQAYDRGHVVSLTTFGDPHLAAVLLKKYLHDLPEPVFPEKLYPAIRRCPSSTHDPTDISSVTYVRETLLSELPPCAYILLSNVLHLLHEVSLRSASNRMDAHNLTVVICPNLVSSPNPLRDVMMCSIPNSPTFFSAMSTPSFAASQSNPAVLAEGKTTLGMVIKLCIQRYYEVFDEVPDRTEALPHTPQSPFADTPASPTCNRDSMLEDDEEIDDAMLVMPIGPSAGGNAARFGGSNMYASTSGGTSTFKPRHRPTQSKETLAARSTHTYANGSVHPNGIASAYGTVNKARSTISIEKGGPARKGSIAVGRGTTRKASGAGVEAIGITAAGFFNAPDAPPVPPLPVRREGGGREVV